MKVREVIEQLNACDQEAEVFVYSRIDEGGDKTHKVLSMEEAKEQLYFKGDAPWRFFRRVEGKYVECEKLVVIG